jgi:hypothetical protein
MPIHVAMVSQTVCFGVWVKAKQRKNMFFESSGVQHGKSKLTWLVLGGDAAVRSRRVEQFTAL